MIVRLAAAINNPVTHKLSGKRGSIAISASEVSNDGVISLEAPLLLNGLGLCVRDQELPIQWSPSLSTLNLPRGRLKRFCSWKIAMISGTFSGTTWAPDI